MKKTWKRLYAILLILLLAFPQIQTSLPVKAEGTGKGQKTETQKASDGKELELEDLDPETLHVKKLGEEDAPVIDGASTEDLNALVRVSVFLEEKGAADAGYSTENIGTNSSAASYRSGLEAKQNALVSKIESALGYSVNVKWNLTLLTNAVSCYVKLGDIPVIEKMAGVRSVERETQYEAQPGNGTADPNTANTSSGMVGATTAWADGYSGAGSRIAIIDTGLDTSHQSFAADAFNYSIDKLGKTSELMTQQNVSAVKSQLNSNSANYVSAKIPYGYNYVDNNTTINHLSDTQGEHGSHVAGIAAANRYIKSGSSYVEAASSVHAVGMAPDAQLLIMKVFGSSGGAYDSDYMAAIEDAIVLGCDSANLSLGGAVQGLTYSSSYQSILNRLASADNPNLVVTISAGNSYGLTQFLDTDLYIDDVSMHTGGSPGTYINSLCVAAAENIGSTGSPLTFNGSQTVYYSETESTGAAMTSIAGSYSYVYIDAIGNATDYSTVNSAASLSGKIVIVNRGDLSFSEKGNNAKSYSPKAVIVANNQAGMINMDLTDYTGTFPMVSITLADAETIKANSTKKTTGSYTYYTGTVTVSSTIQSGLTTTRENAEVTDFSSWGVPGSLLMKPEITAPGGDIYSVWGTNKTSSGTAGGSNKYEMMSGTSMAAPHMAGLAAIVAQYLRENDVASKNSILAANYSIRAINQSLLMSTATPMKPNGVYYPILRQGAGLAEVSKAVEASSVIMMDNAGLTTSTGAAADGKVKAEFGDDPARNGLYTYSFTIYNITDQALTYSFRTDLFTQGRYTSDGAVFMDESTTALQASVSYAWENIGGTSSSHDINKDGLTNNEDAQAILDYLTGAKTASEVDVTSADMDGDGSITTKDAQLLIDWEGGEGTVGANEVPAHGKRQVTVTIRLTDAQKSQLNADYPSGAYVEGFTYVTCNTSDQEGHSYAHEHSIPLLGFYGSWTDPSMFDNTSYTDTLYGTAKTPYTGNTNTNYVEVTYNGTKKKFSGNPYTVEAAFPTERLAVNSESKFGTIYYNLIRAAGTTGFAVSKLDAIGGNVTGVLNAATVGNNVEGIWYYQSTGTWYNLGTKNYSVNKAASAYGLKAGDKFRIGFYALPEYNGMLYNSDLTDAGAGKLNSTGFKAVLESNVLGKGAFVGYDFTVDNTAPEITSATLNGNMLTIAATDNLNLAYVAVMSMDGSTVYAQAVPAAASYSATVDISNAIANANGYVAVFAGDYAGNEVAVALKVNDNEGGEDTVYVLTNTLAAGDDVLIVSTNSTGTGYALTYTLNSSQTTATTAATAVSIKAGTSATGGQPYIESTGLDTKAVWSVGTGSSSGTNTFNNNGWYLRTSSRNNLTITKDTSRRDWTWDSTNNRLRYGSNYYLRYASSTFSINTATNSVYLYKKTTVEQINDPYTVTSITLTPSSLDIYRNSEADLTATVMPMTAPDRSVTWSSSNASVATVDENGHVTAVSGGSATITVTSNANPSVSSSCAVTVTSVNKALNGIVWDEEGGVYFSSFNASSLPTWTKLHNDAKDIQLTSAFMQSSSALYAFTLDTNAAESEMYSVNRSSYALTDVAPLFYFTTGVARGVTNSTYSAYASMVYSLSSYLACGNVTSKTVSLSDGSSFTGVGIPYGLTDLSETIGDVWIAGVAAKAIGSTSSTYYFLDENGIIWQTTLSYGTFIYEGEEEEGFFFDTPIKIIETGISTSFLYQSLYYDGTYIYWSHQADEVAELIIINPSSGTIYHAGNFGQGVWPVCGLYVNGSVAPASEGEAPEGEGEVLEGLQIAKTREEIVTEEVLQRFAEEAAKFANKSTAQEEEKTPAGGLNFISADALKSGRKAVVRETEALRSSDGTTEVEYSENEAVANGLIEVDYDPEILTYQSTSSALAYKSVYHDVANGKIVFAYANADPIAAETTIAEFIFNSSCEDTEVTIVTKERGAELGLEEEETIEVQSEGHTLVKTEAKEPTCTEPGNTAYWTCTDCGKFFSDAEGEHEIEEGSWIIPATGHNWGEPFITWIPKTPDEFVWEETTWDAVTADDVIAITMSKDGRTFVLPAEGNGGKGQPLAVDLAEAAFEIDATSFKTAGTDGIGWVREGAEGSYKLRTSKDSSKYLYSINDNNGLRIGTIGSYLGTLGLSAENYLTLSSSSSTRYLGVFNEADWRAYTSIVSNIAGQTLQIWKLKAPEEAYDAATATRTCQTDPTHTETIDATVTSQVTTVTCETAGETVYTATATFSDGTVATATKTVTVPALGHDYELTGWAWAEDHSTATAVFICKNDSTHVEEIVATVTSQITPATCETAGLAVYTATATFEGEIYTNTDEVTLAALGHDWEFKGFSWTGSDEAGYTAAVADYTCRNDETHTQTVAATVTSESSAAGCEEPGTVTYTATVTEEDSLDHTEHTETKTVEGAVLGHDYELTGWTWVDDYSAATATFTCKNDASHVQTVEATVTSQTTPAGCETAGKTVYTATVTFEGNPYTDTKEVAIEATGHDWGVPVFNWIPRTPDEYVWEETTWEAVTEDDVIAITMTKGDVTYLLTSTYGTGNPPAALKLSTVDAAYSYGATFFKSAAINEFSWIREQVDGGYAFRVNGTTDKYLYSTNTNNGVRVGALHSDGGIFTLDGSGYLSVNTTDKRYMGVYNGQDWRTYVNTTGNIAGQVLQIWKLTTEVEEAYDEATATRTCKTDPTHTETVNATVTSETIPATCETAGKTVYTATAVFDGVNYTDTKEVAIPAFGHDWEFTGFVWTNNDANGEISAAAAVYVCKNDPNHVEEVEAVLTSVTTPATCEEAGSIVYTATVTAEQSLDKVGHTGTKTDTIEALGHDYELTGWTWAEDYSTASALFTCSNNAEHKVTEAAAVTSAAGTGENLGYTVYTATVVFEGETYTDVKAVVNQYTITFYADEGDAEPYAVITQDYGTAITLPEPPVKQFHTFDGWNPEVPATMPAENMTVYAVWAGETEYYLVGDMTNWQIDENYLFTSNPHNEGEYYLAANLTEGCDIKVVSAVEGVIREYYPSTEHPGYNGTVANYTVDANHSGNVTVYFRPYGNFADPGWQYFGGYFYIEQDSSVEVRVAEGDGEAYVVRDGNHETTFTAPQLMTIEVVCEPGEYYELDRIELWKLNGDGQEEKISTLEGNSFTMANYDVIVKVYFKALEWTFDNFTWTETENGFTAVANYHCTSDPEKTRTLNATVTSVETPATCETAGAIVYTANVTEDESHDGAAHSDEHTVEIPALGHNLVKTEAKTPTCTEAGNTEYWTCTVCGKFFSDEEGEHEIEENSWILPALGHSLIKTEAKEPTCTETGNTAYWTCTVCGKFFSDAEGEHEIEENSWILPATGHKWGEAVFTWGEAYVWELTTWDEVTEEDVIAVTMSLNEVTYILTSKNGDASAPPAIVVTLESDGQSFRTEAIETYGWIREAVTGGYTLRVNGTDDQYLFTTNANNGVRVGELESYYIVNLDAATQYLKLSPAAGSGIRYLGVFNRQDFRAYTSTSVNIGGQTLQIWKLKITEAATGTRTCENDPDHTETVECDVKEEVTKAATCEEDGEITYTATAEFADGTTAEDVKKETIPALGHDWNDPVIVWAEEGYTATATRTCKNDPEHVEELEVTVTSEVTTEPTCEGTGVRTYTATVTIGEAVFTSTKEETLPATGHDWNNPVIVWAEEGYTATATRTCKNDPEHVEELEVTVTSEVATEPTCEGTGVRTYTATVTIGEAVFTSTKEETLPATGHDWNNPVIVWAEEGYTATATRTCKNDPEHVEELEVTVTSEVTTEPTCEGTGVRTYTATVTIGEAVFTSTKEETLLATGHDWNNPVIVWAEEGYTATATRTCKNDPEHVEELEVTVTSEVTTEPTCEGTGVRTYTATVTIGEAVFTSTKEETLPATGHDWNVPVITWEGYESATATRTCKNDATHTETVDCVITDEVTEEATATTDGVRTYTATGTFKDGTVATDTKTEVIPAYGWTWQRLAGSDRYGTMAEVIGEAYPEAGTLKTLIVATGASFPDALAGSGLAGVYGCPIILTRTDKLTAQAKSEIERLMDPEGCEVIILGGIGTVAEKVETAIRAIGENISTRRVAGTNRELTAIEVYKDGVEAENGFTKGGTVIIATGYSFADALSISPYAYAAKTPILLAKKDGSLSKQVKELLESEGFTKAIIIGGTGSVSEASETYLKDKLGMAVLRLEGSNRYETSAAIVRWELGLNKEADIQPEAEMTNVGMGVATGASFPDALGSVSLLGKTGSVLLLVADNNKTNTAATEANIEELIAPFVKDMTKGYIFGGTGTVSEQIEGWLNAAIK